MIDDIRNVTQMLDELTRLRTELADMTRERDVTVHWWREAQEDRDTWKRKLSAVQEALKDARRAWDAYRVFPSFANEKAIDAALSGQPK